MQIASINVGRTTGTPSGLQAVLGVVTAAIPFWSVIFVSEADGFQDHRNAPPLDHTCIRHYPGHGSWAMLFVIRRSMGKYVRSRTWRGRCGVIHLLQRGSPGSTGVNLYLIGVHGAHGELIVDTFTDLAFLLRQRPYGSKVVITGDWNVDILPTLFSDPWSDASNREHHHADRRLLLEVLTNRFNIILHCPSRCQSVPGGPFSYTCTSSPITRVPVGITAEYVLPSVVDFCVASNGVVRETAIHWQGAPADHALFVIFFAHLST